MSLKLLKIAAIMKQFNCTKKEAEVVKRTGNAPVRKKMTTPVVKVTAKKETVTKSQLNDKEAS